MTDPLTLVLERVENAHQWKDGQWMASCPGRHDPNPSLSIRMSEDGTKVLLHDFGGSTTEEIVTALGIEMTDLFVDDENARRDWGKMQQVANAPTAHERNTRKPRKQYKEPAIPEGATFREGSIKWFAKRGISQATMEHFGVYTEERYFHKAGGNTPAICIPYRRNGKPVNVKYRSATVKDFLMSEGSEPIWFNLDAVTGATDVIIVEGEFDVMVLHEAGITNVISPPSGCKSLTEEVMESGKHFLLDDRVRIILAGDNDKPGKELMDDIARRVGKERCASVEWPDECKDANDVLLRFGPQRVAQCVLEASPLPFDGVIDPEAIIESMWTIFGEGLPRGVSTGIAKLDEHYTVLPGYWTLVTGAPSSGKTALMNNVMVNIAEREGWHFGVCSLENPDEGIHAMDLLSIHARQSVDSGRSDCVDAETFANGAKWVNDYFHFVKPEEPSIAAVLKAAKGLVFSKGIKGLIIDPWNELDHPPSGLNSGDYISKCLSQIRQFAFRYDLHIWLVAHPTKLQKGSNDQYPVPTPYDVSGSAHFFNKADYCIATWRDWLTEGKPVDIHIQKARRASVAKRGVVQLGFHVPTTRFYDAEATGEEGGGEWRPILPWEEMAANETPFDEGEEVVAAVPQTPGWAREVWGDDA